ncbi:FecCD family ABC transporter permease [Desulfovibrio litoralis]|uniref:Iron complex transport system permease protein n=1 Tax=Desulfovibrio litoralis DSM 11393 TaxID=1121455 RepID=A0A1M7S752_9BACT|nr:iron ABC transporter permease [Desulfovibrio litoralis]SHN54270.1 iron complex transport system permease protein [Desulfovibrio litoralis DSM 11393]
MLNSTQTFNLSLPKSIAKTFWFSLLLLILVSFVLACMSGVMELSFNQVLGVFFSVFSGENTDKTHSLVILNLRFARAVLAFFGGAALGVAGLILQNVLQNPLADAFTLGVASGSAFGAVLALVLGLPVFVYVFGVQVPLLSFMALFGALLALIFVFFIAFNTQKKARSLASETLILAGVICSSFLAALISLLKALNEDAVPGIVFWIMGSFQGKSWTEFQLMLPLSVLGFVLIYLFKRPLDLLSLGNIQATQLGVSTRSIRLVLILGASALSAATVSVAGIIGFVGLLVPHFVRLLFLRLGYSVLPSKLILPTALIGGLLLLWADVLARRLLSFGVYLGFNNLSGVDLPVGVVTALIGVPFFCWILKYRYE